MEKEKKEEKKLESKFFDLPVKQKSLPLILPDNFSYDIASGVLTKKSKSRGKLQVVPSVAALLGNIAEPLAVVGICGQYRMGKSYVLSRVLDSKDGFELGHTLDSKTMGIWIGTRLLRKDGFLVLLLDTEGIFAVDASNDADNAIFVLTVLLSSILIYNSGTVPRSVDLEKMEFITKLASNIRVKQDLKSNGHEFRDHFPDFVWLLRDVLLQPTDKDGHPCDFSTYLHDKVLVKDDDWEETKADKVRKAILGFFKTIDCWALPPPSSDKDVVRNMDKVDDSKLSPDFIHQMNALIQHLYKKYTPKLACDKSKINGPVYKILVEEYVKAVNTPGAVPTIGSTWERTKSLLIEQALEQAVITYNNRMTVALKDKLPLSHKDLMDIHIRGQNQSFDTMNKILSPIGKITDDNTRNRFNDRVIKTENISEGKIKVTGGLLYGYIRTNREMTSKLCKEILQNLYKPIKDKVKDAPANYTMALLDNDFQALQGEYFKQSRGDGEVIDSEFGEFLKIVDADKSLFKNIKNFSDSLHKERVKTAQIEAENHKIQQENYQMQITMKKNAEENQKQIQQMMEHQHQKMLEFQAEQDKRRETEQHKMLELMNARFEQDAKKTESLLNAQQRNFGEFMAQMKEQQALNQKSVDAMVALAARPVPAPVVHVQRGGGCFHTDSMINCEEGMKSAREIKVGDYVEGVDGKGQIIMSQVYFVNTIDEEAIFYEITVCGEDGGQEKTIRLTGEHLLFTSKCTSDDQTKEGDDRSGKEHPRDTETMMAQEVQVGAWMWSSNKATKQSQRAQVMKVEAVVMKGYVCILTEAGSIVVDGVVASCFEIHHKLQAVQCQAVQALRYISPSIVNHDWFKKAFVLWDECTAPLDRLVAQFLPN